MEKIKTYKGSCHCGNINFDFNSQQSIGEFSVRRCDCDFCTKTGTRYISDPNGELVIKIKDQTKVVQYEFGTKTAGFYICTVCGCMPMAISEIEGENYGIVNVNTLEKAEHFSRHASKMSYDEETLDDRLDRRKKNWIGKVSFIA